MATAGNQLVLRDIHIPASIDWWPPAPGWWILAGLILAMVILTTWWYRRWRARYVQRAAKQALAEIRQAYAQHHDGQVLVQQLSTLLRRACLSTYARDEVAGLTGEAWLAFLDQGLAKQKKLKHRFSDDVGRVLTSAPYQRAGKINGEVLLTLCDYWIGALPTPAREAR